jgi:hypothetical protein
MVSTWVKQCIVTEVTLGHVILDDSVFKLNNDIDFVWFRWVPAAPQLERVHPRT